MELAVRDSVAPPQARRRAKTPTVG
jgi:hypothetical protein